MKNLDTQITLEKLENFKAFYPNDEKIQSLTLEEVLENTKGKVVDWNVLSGAESEVPLQATVSECQKAIAYVLFDVVCLALGAIALRRSVRASAIQGMAAAAAPVMSKLEIIIASMTAAGATKLDVAKGVLKILQALYSGGCLGGVFSSFVSSLSLWDKIFYGLTGLATIVAILTTGGSAFIAEVVILLATFGFLVSDCVKVHQTCHK